MKFVIINALYSFGGTEIQTHREAKILRKKGHQVMIITFDPSKEAGLKDNCFNIPFHDGKIKRVITRHFGNKSLTRRIKNIVDEFKPDLIHINNLHDNAISVLRALGGYPVIKTIRASGLICPAGTCLRRDMSLCDGYKYSSCLACLYKKLNYIVLNLSLPKIRKEYSKTVDKFICPSQFLSEVYIANGFSTITINNPFDFSIVKKYEAIKSNVFLYYGAISDIKGVSQLILAFKRFRRSNKESILYLAGRIAPGFDKTLIENKQSEGLYYLGVKKQNEIMELYKQIGCVIVPSLWLENYPNTVLEAIACKTIVIGSNRGEIPELINNDKLCFDPTSVEDIENKLNYVHNLSLEEIKSITQKAYDAIVVNNSIENYYAKLINQINLCIHGEVS